MKKTIVTKYTFKSGYFEFEEDFMNLTIYKNNFYDSYDISKEEEEEEEEINHFKEMKDHLEGYINDNNDPQSEQSINEIYDQKTIESFKILLKEIIIPI